MATAAGTRTPAAERDSEVKSLTKALDLLCCFTTENPEWGVTELAQYLGMYKSTAHRLLTTFEKLRFVERTPGRRYRLGIRTVELGNMFQLNDQLIRVAERGLRKLAEETKSITHLSKLDGRDTVELLRFSGAENWPFSSKAAVRREAHATAKGKIFLAYNPEFLQRFVGKRQFFKKYTFLTIDTPDKLRQEAAQIVKQGYAVDNQESRITMRCLAVPVCTGSGTLIAALSLSNTTDNMPIDEIPRLLPKLLRLSKAISRDLLGRRM